MTPAGLHIAFLFVSGITLLAAVGGNAAGYFRLSPSVWPIGQAIIRFGMATAGSASMGAALLAWATGATWRDRIAWELAASAGFMVLSIGLLVGAIERDILRRTARKNLSQQHGGD
jgi:hypothetical protein